MILTDDLINFLESPGDWLRIKQAELNFSGQEMDNPQYYSLIKNGTRVGTIKNFLQIVKKIKQIEN